MTRFQGKIAVVLGGNSGIGLATAKAFAGEGARVVITGRNPETLATAARDIGPDTLTLESDIADLDALDALMEKVRETHGRIDVLFVNAGIGGFVPVEDVDAAYWERIVGTNLRGPYFAVQKALPLMGEGGAIVFTSSLGHVKGLPGNSVYAATKAGIRSLARNLGAELVERGIRVNCFSPGPVDTPIITRTEGLPADQIPAVREMITGNVPMKRFGTPEEAARTVLFLASDDASYITGIDLLMDGGAGSF